jgi:ketosteroid isomerase-like protein
LITQRGPNSGTKRGRDGVQGFLEDYISAFGTVVWEPEEFSESGDQVVVLITTRSRPKGGSVDIVTRNGHLWTIRDEAIISMETFPDPAEALEAAGQAE